MMVAGSRNMSSVVRHCDDGGGGWEEGEGGEEIMAANWALPNQA